MKPRLFGTSAGLLLSSGLLPAVAHSQIYLAEDQAAQSIFPGQSWTRRTIELTSDEIRTIEERSGEKVRNPKVVVLVSKRGAKVVYLDRVLGKHEFITYAVGVTEGHRVGGVEILEYRETYGHQVRGEDWRRQFLGKDASAPLRLKQDIVNISGATLSSAHVTAGVRRLLCTHEIVQTHL